MHEEKFEEIKEIAEDAYNHLGSGFNEDLERSERSSDETELQFERVEV